MFADRKRHPAASPAGDPPVALAAETESSQSPAAALAVERAPKREIGTVPLQPWHIEEIEAARDRHVAAIMGVWMGVLSTSDPHVDSHRWMIEGRTLADTEQNGLALCSLHHKAFDLGAFTIRPDRMLLVSEHVHGQRGCEEWLLRYHGQAVRRPVRESYLPEPGFLSWHQRKVFKRPARELCQ